MTAFPQTLDEAFAWLDEVLPDEARHTIAGCADTELLGLQDTLSDWLRRTLDWCNAGAPLAADMERRLRRWWPSPLRPPWLDEVPPEDLVEAYWRRLRGRSLGPMAAHAGLRASVERIGQWAWDQQMVSMRHDEGAWDLGYDKRMAAFAAMIVDRCEADLRQAAGWLMVRGLGPASGWELGQRLFEARAAALESRHPMVRRLVEATAKISEARAELEAQIGSDAFDPDGRSEASLSAELHAVRALLDTALQRFAPLRPLRDPGSGRVEPASLSGHRRPWSEPLAGALRELDRALAALPGPVPADAWLSRDHRDEASG